MRKEDIDSIIEAEALRRVRELAEQNTVGLAARCADYRRHRWTARAVSTGLFLAVIMLVPIASIASPNPKVMAGLENRAVATVIIDNTLAS